MNEIRAAKLIAHGRLSSPFYVDKSDIYLVNLRVTGTGAAYRAGNSQFVFRPPENFLTKEVLEMVNGTPLIVEHPDNDTKVIDDDSDIVGSVFYPYIKGSEIWAVCKVFKDKTATALNDGVFSTSPSFIATGEIKIIDEKPVYFEDAPLAINHIALLPTKYGVWDKFKPENREKAIEMSTKKPPLVWNDEAGAYEPLEDFDNEETGGGSKDDLIISLLEKIVAKLDSPAPAPAMPAPEPAPVETAPVNTPDAETVEVQAEPTAVELEKRINDLEVSVNAARSDEDNEKIANVENDSAVLKGMGIGNGARISSGENAIQFKKRVIRENWEQMKSLGIESQTAAAFANSLDVLNDEAALELPYRDSVTALKGVKPKAVDGAIKTIERIGIDGELGVREVFDVQDPAIRRKFM